MVRSRWLFALLAITVLLSVIGAKVPFTAAQNQASTSDRPLALAQGLKDLATVAQIAVPELDVAKERSDAVNRPSDAPLRFAKDYQTSLDIKQVSTIEVVGNRTVARLRISAPKALSINLGYTRYTMPKSGQLFMYSPDYRSIIGPYGAADNEDHGQLWTPIVAGDEMIIEYSADSGEFATADLTLSAINRGFSGFGVPRDLLVDKSGSCNVDVVCPEGDDWREDINAVAAYTRNGLDMCTGSLVNNTAQDQKPYFLTAAHCGVTAANSATVVTYWNYESTLCRTVGSTENGTPLPKPNTTMTGATLIANYAPSDFALLELDDAVPSEYAPYWSGWNAQSGDFASVVAIHHPGVEEKRISFENQATQTTGYNSNTVPGDGTHIRVIDWDLGTTEGGSSGSPLYDPQHRVVGQLHGGGAACGNDLSDWYGRVSVSWNGGGTPATRLKDWLDPTNSGTLVLDGSAGSPAYTVNLSPASLAVCAPASGQSTVNLTWISGFSEPVNLSASNLPAGVTATFTPNPVISPTLSSQLTIGNVTAAAAGDYTVVVHADSASITRTADLDLSISGGIPSAAPTLTAPANNATDVSDTPTFSWSNATGADSYVLEIASDANFSNLVYTATTELTSLTSAPLSTNTKHYWRVRAANACGVSANSTVFSFTTEAAPGDCTIGTETVVTFEENFETNPNWASGGTGNTWAHGAFGYGGTSGMKAIDPTTASDQWLTTPAITLTEGLTHTLQFWNAQTIEDRTAGGCYDGALIEVSTDGGSAWDQIPNASLLTDPYNGAITASSNPLNGRDAWCGDPQDWLKSVVDLSAYNGETVMFRFRLASDSSVGRDDGWKIDNVSVKACTEESEPEGPELVYLPAVTKN
ncbi:S1 family peptidase [Herpetosiphon llansteffanensis]|uniref:S1 family peptidase n=1 Tax=Herpetosiphon llansteffanensis TaxID=2094568 RepID=UPI000D7C4C93|nr:serine protease [Herpetosiphon llansteffanensis]